jgi:hypothetical protein
MNDDYRLLSESMYHWLADIIVPLINGEKIIQYGKYLLWEDRRILVECYTGTCPLCMHYPYLCGDIDNNECPLDIFGLCCNNPNSPWRAFKDNPCLETADGMYEAIKRVRDAL